MKNVTCHEVFVFLKNFSTKSTERTQENLEKQISKTEQELKKNIISLIEKGMDIQKLAPENMKRYLYPETERKTHKPEREKSKKYLEKKNFKSSEKKFNFKSEEKTV